MAFSNIGSLGSNAIKANGTNIGLTTIAPAAVGSLVIVVVAIDNQNTGDGDFSEVDSISESRNNTWLKAAEFTNGQGAANAGATISVWYSQITTALPSPINMFANLANSKTAKVITVWNFGVGAGNTVELVGGASLASDDGFGSAVISGLPSQEYLFVACGAIEGTIGTVISGNLGGTALTANNTSGGSGATNIRGGGAFSIETATGKTAMPGGTTEAAYVLIAFKEVSGGTPPPVQNSGFFFLM